MDRVLFYTDYLSALCNKYPYQFPNELKFFLFSMDRCPFVAESIFCFDGVIGKYNLMTVPRSFIIPFEMNRTSRIREKNIVLLGYKRPVALFLGRYTNEMRIELARKAWDNPHFYVRLLPTKKEHTGQIYNFSFMEEEEQIAFKYIIVPDGSSLPDRFSRQLGYGSVVLKSKSPYYEFWWDHLEVGKDYLSFESVDELIDMVDGFESPAGQGNITLQNWLQEVALNGREKFLRFFSNRTMDCYTINTLYHYEILRSGDFIPVINSPTKSVPYKIKVISVAYDDAQFSMTRLDEQFYYSFILFSSSVVVFSLSFYSLVCLSVKIKRAIHC